MAGEGATAWDRSSDWADPLKRPTAAPTDEPCRCGHSPEAHHGDTGGCTFVTMVRQLGHPDGYLPSPCLCMAYVPPLRDTGAEDRRDEAKAAARSAELHAEYVAAARDAIDALVRWHALHRTIVPPDPAKAKQSYEIADEVAADGLCRNCWRNDQQQVVATIDRRTGKPIFPGLCEWCGRMRNLHGFLPDLQVLQKRHAGRHVTKADWAEAAKRNEATRPAKGKKKRKGRVAA